MHFFTGSRSFTSSLFPLTSSLPSPSSRATKIQQPKIFLHSNKTSPNTFPAQKSLPTLPRANHEPTRAFSGQTRANLGRNWAIWGRFWVDSGLSRAKIAPIWGPLPPLGSPLLPGRCAKTSPPTLRMRTHPLHLAFSKSHKIALYYHK